MAFVTKIDTSCLHAGSLMKSWSAWFERVRNICLGNDLWLRVIRPQQVRVLREYDDERANDGYHVVSRRKSIQRILQEVCAG